MSDIDPEKLEQAIRFVESIADMDRAEFGPSDWELAKLAAAAARAHLATLPRFKEVETGCWVVVDAQGRVGAFLYHTDADARDAAYERGHGSQVVRLTGTAKVKVTP